jgi:isoamylase
LSQGVPMLLGGDELSQSQRGNNNTYCHDSELTWLKWNLDERQNSFLGFVKKVIHIWMTQPVFQRRKFFKGRALRGSKVNDISFFNPSGKDMSDDDWNAGFVKCIGVRLAGDLIDDEDERGEPIVGDTLLLLLNAHHEPLSFMLPLTNPDHRWERLLDTAAGNAGALSLGGGESYPLEERSLAILRTYLPGETVSTSGAQPQAVGKESKAPRAGRPPLDL